MKNFKTIYFTSATIAALLFTSCKKETVTPDPEPEPVVETPQYTVPTTYNFTNVDMSQSLSRVNMFKEMVAYVRSTHNATAQVTIDAKKLQNMYVNTGNPFSDAALNSSGVSLKEKTNNTFGFIAKMESYLNEAAATSQSTVEGKDGVAGKVLGPVPTTSTAVRASWLLNAKGFEYKELVEKGGMGAIFYAEAMTILNKISSYDNATVQAGKGTAQEHAWDEAFGYFGVPLTFPTTTTGLSYWGSYCNSVNNALPGTSSTIMNAWLKGRAAISNKDNAARDEARNTVIASWEKVGAARLITYLKQAKTNFSNDGQRSHALSEGHGFIEAFRYNSAKTISDADINLLASYLGDNLYLVSISNIDNAINKTAEIFGLDASKL